MLGGIIWPTPQCTAVVTLWWTALHLSVKFFSFSSSLKWTQSHANICSVSLKIKPNENMHMPLLCSAFILTSRDSGLIGVLKNGLSLSFCTAVTNWMPDSHQQLFPQPCDELLSHSIPAWARWTQETRPSWLGVDVLYAERKQTTNNKTSTNLTSCRSMIYGILLCFILEGRRLMQQFTDREVKINCWLSWGKFEQEWDDGPISQTMMMHSHC